jgi:aminoglycoside phosphotransferase (APT) family kinase protein
MRREGHGSPEIRASTPLLSRADELLAGAAVPVGPTGLVHGDLWEGNTVWHDGELSGTIDWEAAGVGPAGVDLGSLRLDAALLHGLQAADDVLAGWEDAIGSSFEHVAYWDVVAAAQTPADMALFLPTIHEERDARTSTAPPQPIAETSSCPVPSARSNERSRVRRTYVLDK